MILIGKKKEKPDLKDRAFPLYLAEEIYLFFLQII